MKHFGLQVLIVLSIGIIASCGEKKEPNYIITKREVKKAPSGTGSMQAYVMEDTVTWKGKVYKYTISRKPDNSLPKVKDDSGREYYDNSIDVRIGRSDGTSFFNKTYTKSDFDSYLTEAFKADGTLEGLVFDKAESGYLQFAASVAFPHTDEFIPLIIRISADGSVTVMKDNMLDTAGNED